MTRAEKVKFLEDHGWYSWYSPNYWVHSKIVSDSTRQNCTDYGMDVDAAYEFEIKSLPPFKYYGLPALSQLLYDGEATTKIKEKLKFDEIKVELQEWMGSDRSIAESAWTSSLDYAKKQTRSKEDVIRVVNMLADSKHSTPFESVVLRFWCKWPISTDRQHMTHRLQSPNGQSARYRTMPAEWQHIPEDVKEILIEIEEYNSQRGDDLACLYEELCGQSNDFYQQAVSVLKDYEKRGLLTNNKLKRCREFFRNVLPQGNLTERTFLMNLRSFANYQKLRNSKHAQPEIEYAARLMLDEVKKNNVCPIAIEALERNGWDI